MPDNVTVPGIGSVATKNIDGVHYQRNILSNGGSDVAEGNPLPILLTNAPELPPDAATETTLLQVIAAIEGIGTAGTTQYADGASVPTPTGVAVNWNDAGVQRNVSAAKPLPVSGPLTDTQLRNSAVPVSGTLTANIGTAGTLALDATLTGGTAKSIVRGAAKGSTAAADATVGSVDANINALDVYVRGSVATGGTSSSFGSAVPATGTAAGFSDGTNLQSARTFDGDSGAGVQNILGVMLRQPASGGSVPVDNTTPLAVQQAALGSNDLPLVAGNIAHDAVDSGGPVKIGAIAIAHGTNPTAVAAADRTNLYANRAGIPFVIGGHPNVITREVLVTDADGAKNDAVALTVGTGAKAVVTRLTVTADKANTGDTAVRVGFGSATLPAAALAGVAGILGSHSGIAAGGGFNVGDGSGIIGIGGDDEDIRFTCEDPAGGSITITFSYYTVSS